MKPFRLTSGEIQKILMRPILYILTFAIVLCLFFSTTLTNNMTDRANAQKYNFDNCSTAEQVKASFYQTEPGSISKNYFDEKIEKTYSDLLFYQNENDKYDPSYVGDTSQAVVTKVKSLIADITDQYHEFATKHNLYCSDPTLFTTEAQVIIKGIQDKIQLDLQEITTLCNKYLHNKKIDTPAFFITTEYEKAFQYIYTGIYDNLIGTTAKPVVIDTVQALDNVYKSIENCGDTKIKGKSYIDKLVVITDSLIPVQISNETLSKLFKQKEQTTEYLGQTLKDKIDTATTMEQMTDLCLEYYYLADDLCEYIHSAIKLEPVKTMTDSKANTFYGYEGVIVYQLKQTTTRDAALLAKNWSTNKYASVFSTTTSFSDKVSAFDLMYMGLEICGFVIIIFCVVLAGSMIAGEHSNGTLKVLALRPFSRRKILSSKIRATLIFGFIYILFSALVLGIMGYFMYGFDLTPIVSVFNASVVFAVSPIVMMLIYIALLMLKLAFYVLIACLISVVLRSNVWAVTISLLIYVISSVFSILFATTYWYAYTPFASIDLFKFFGGNFVTGSNQFAIALSTPLFYNSNFVVSAVTVGVIMVLLITISHIVFKKREIR